LASDFDLPEGMSLLNRYWMRQTKSYIWLVFFMGCLTGVRPAYAQELFVGIVVDSATLNALPAVNIQIKNSGTGTTTDEKGDFSIPSTRGDTLVFSLVGYQTVELPLAGYEAGVIRLSEKYTLLQAVTIDEYRRENPYEGMFEDQNSRLKRNIPFYFSKAKKEKIKVEILKQENLRVKTYVEVVVNSSELKTQLMTKYSLSEKEYYDILTTFNETHYGVMYYLTRSELMSLLNSFFESRVSGK
jgi:hypothetical protein